MHDIKWIREYPEAFDRGLMRRGLKPQARHLISIDERRRAIIRVLESWKERRNSASKEIGKAKARNDEALVQKLLAEVAESKESISRLEQEQREVEDELRMALEQIPNLPADDVPDGTDASSNVERHKYHPKREIKFEAFEPKQHFDLGEGLGQMDFAAAAKLSGARFVVLKNGLARLERALAQFMLDLHTGEHGYTEVNPPILVRDAVMYGTAQLPKFAEDQFSTFNKAELIEVANNFISNSIIEAVERIPTIIKEIEAETGHSVDPAHALRRLNEIITADMPLYKQQLFNSLSELLRLWLIPTAEVPLTNLVREEIIEAALPMRLTACTPCFRAEAGAAGKDTRGMIRQHQFTKVELVSIATPEQSSDEHERMLSCAEEVLRRLDLRYRTVTLCTGDMGFAAQKTYDIEVWLPGQGAFREISSCSNCGEFQARRMEARYRPKGTVPGSFVESPTRVGGKTFAGRPASPRFVHTLNGSGVAVGRALIAVMETYQQGDGSIAVPDALQPYMGGVKVIERAAS